MPRAWLADHRKLAEPKRWIDVNPGPNMSRCAAFFLLVCSFLAGVTSERYMTGGWEKRDPHRNPHFQELAHFAVSKGSKPKPYYDTVVTLIEVHTQVSIFVTRTPPLDYARRRNKVPYYQKERKENSNRRVKFSKVLRMHP